MIDAIESVVSQTRPVQEILVVDDGSDDGTPDVVKRSFPWVRVLTTPSVGPGAARNAGAMEAAGDLFMFLDSDDLWLENHVQVLLARVRSGFDVAYGVTHTRDEISDRQFLIPDNGVGVHGDCFSGLLKWCFMVPSAMAVTRRAFFRAGGFGQGMLGEDWLFSLRLAAVFPFAFVPEVIASRVLHRESLCCLACQGEKILGLLCKVREMAHISGRDENGLADRIEAMMMLVEERGQEWETVQDWFEAMKKEDLL